MSNACASPPPNTPWWGPLEVPLQGCLQLSLGPFELLVERRSQEWRLRHREDPAATEDRLRRATLDAFTEDDAAWAAVERIGTETRGGDLTTRPRTADRPIVSRPVDPFIVPPSTSIVLYVSTPLWIEVLFHGASVLDVPAMRPRNTWIGEPAGPGEAGYANRTQCRQQLDEIPIRPHRALTPVAVENRGSAPRALERVMLAVPYLSLFATEDARLFTERIEVTIGADVTESRIAEGAPGELGGVHVVAPARREAPSGRLGRLLADVF